MTDMPPTKQARDLKRLAGIAVVAGVVIIALAAYAFTGQSTKSVAVVSTPTAKATTSPTVSPAASSPATMTSSTSVYKDGTYSGSGEYTSPGGQQKVSVALSVADDTITAVTVTNEATDNESSQYQKKFVSGIQSVVVGKKLADLKVSTVSGSSLTSQGFNEALTTIKSEAKA